MSLSQLVSQCSGSAGDVWNENKLSCKEENIKKENRVEDGNNIMGKKKTYRDIRWKNERGNGYILSAYWKNVLNRNSH